MTAARCPCNGVALVTSRGVAVMRIVRTFPPLPHSRTDASFTAGGRLPGHDDTRPRLVRTVRPGANGLLQRAALARVLNGDKYRFVVRGQDPGGSLGAEDAVEEGFQVAALRPLSW